MSQGYNRVTLFGNLGADPDLRKLPNGRGMLRLRLATSQSWLNKEGVREERTDWHNVVVWGARAEGLAKVLKRGSFLLVEGQLRTHSYEKDGEKRYATDVHADEVVLGGRRRPSGGGDADPEAAAADVDADTRSDGDLAADMRAEAELHARGGQATPPDDGSRPLREGEGDGPEEVEPVPAHPTRPRGGQGGGDESAEAALPPAPAPRRRTRSPAPLSVMASAA